MNIIISCGVGFCLSVRWFTIDKCFPSYYFRQNAEIRLRIVIVPLLSAASCILRLPIPTVPLPGLTLQLPLHCCAALVDQCGFMETLSDFTKRAHDVFFFYNSNEPNDNTGTFLLRNTRVACNV